MRVFVVGDYRTGTGPANVTKEYLLRFPRDTRRLIFSSKILRAFEIILKVPVSSVLLISGHSKQNLLALKWAGLWHKPCAFLMHGCVDHENAINECPDEDMSRVERKTLELSTAIFAVSRHFAGWLKTNYPEYTHKISAAVNGVDVGLMDEAYDHALSPRDEHMIFTVGGGMPRKKIKHICEAVKQLNDKTGEDKYRLVVIGDKGKDDDEINSYPFVENLGLVSSKEAGKLYDKAALFIQNSCFETFGLAPMEALVHGCSILVSKEVGALELFDGLEDTDIIRNWFDAAEIAYKAEKLLLKGNAGRLITKFDKESSSWEARTMQLWENLITLTEEARAGRR